MPDKWVLESRLLDRRCVDAMPFERNGRPYMFLSPVPALRHAPIAMLYSADTLTSQWQRHAIRPQASDVRSARTGGWVLERDGRWHRPATDCAI